MIIIQGNNIILSGKIGKDPSKKVIKNEYQIIELAIVVGEDEEEKAIWKNVYAWGTLLNGLKKGDQILITGIKEIQEYTTKSGSQASIEKIKAEFVLKMTNSSSQAQQKQELEPSQQLNPIDDDGLPF